MGKTLYKHNYLTVAAMTTALLISTSTAMVFAADTASIKQDVSPLASDAESIGRFIVTPKSSTFVPAVASLPAHKFA